MVDLGSVLESGSAVATILPVTGMQAEDVEYYVSAYLPYGYAKQVRIGMPVVVSLFFAKPSRYGYIKGTINAIGEFATGGSDTAILVGSTSLASKLGSEVGTTMLEVSIALEADPLTPSGFAWTSDIGYPGEVPVLSLCSVEVTVRDDRPIDLVVPWIKDMVGIDQPPELTGSDSGTAK
jgi:HlyD family secretion protein